MNEDAKRIFDLVQNPETGIIHMLKCGNILWKSKKDECVAAFRDVKEKYLSADYVPTDLVRVLIEALDLISDYESIYSENGDIAKLRLEVFQALGDFAVAPYNYIDL